MKNLLLLICLSVCLSSFAQERDINERYLPKKESEQLQKEAQAKPYISKKMLRGGGGEITSTDCYSFVPIPDSAIELDENTPDSGNSLDGAWGPFDLDFEFCHFGINYDQFYINMKGNITFEFSIAMDTATVRRGNQFFGDHVFRVRVTDGVVEFEGLEAIRFSMHHRR